MEKSNNQVAYQPIKSHTPEPWNPIGADLPDLSKTTTRKELKRLLGDIAWVLLALSLFSLVGSWLIW